MSPNTLQPPVNNQDHRIGPLSAPVVLVEYADFQCAQCRSAESLLGAVRAAFGSQLCFVYRHFPMLALHPHAHHAAEASEVVDAQTGPAGFWSMHDLLFAHQEDAADALDDMHLIRYAVTIGVDPESVSQALTGRTYEAQVRSHFLGGYRSGVKGAPAFFINNRRFAGDWTDAAAFFEALTVAERGRFDELSATV
jgi:protein-disulfide isomerase